MFFITLLVGKVGRHTFWWITALKMEQQSVKNEQLKNVELMLSTTKRKISVKTT